ncbi:hypothetical protein H4696_003342 [Amycolatopsis lexingtonensis]|uniref:Uncharacterized protein n=1 Tax=Amycolatopsis lexingtonensis TaxID=218822 RepID=A0ABR9HZ77_9PSEU|nr:hypothetical protein [Amycolatopsis lexingtonensis]MBE1496242.1 hypothetical protein [Amycolatopsis lexingtonensis]
MAELGLVGAGGGAFAFDEPAAGGRHRRVVRVPSGEFGPLLGGDDGVVVLAEAFLDFGDGAGQPGGLPADYRGDGFGRVARGRRCRLSLSASRPLPTARSWSTSVGSAAAGVHYLISSSDCVRGPAVTTQCSLGPRRGQSAG